MKKISASFIQDLISRTNIVDFIGKQVSLKKKGAQYFACCPFHNEKSPSFSVNETKQFFYCFGCHVSGSVIDFIKLSENLTFPEAIEELAAYHGINVEYVNNSSATQPIISQNKRADLYKILQKTVNFYQQNLIKSENKIALDYLKKRGLSQEIIEKFHLGFAENSWNNALFNITKTSEDRKNFEIAGLSILGKNQNYYDRFRNRIMFPIRDRQGNFVAFGGRSIENGEPKYLNSPETIIFQKRRLLYGLFEALSENTSPEFLLIVEGYMDVVSLSQFGINYAVASLGTATSIEQLSLLFRYTNRIICCFDGDDAGIRAAWRTLTISLSILTDEKQIEFLFLPKEHDPDSFIREKGLDTWNQYVQKPQSFSQFFFTHLTQNLNLTNEQGKSNLAANAIPLIEKINAKMLVLHLKNQLIYKLNLRNLSELEQLFEQKESNFEQKPIVQFKLTTMRILIALLIQFPFLEKNITNLNELSQIKMPGISLLIQIVTFCKNNKNCSTAQILENFRNDDCYKQLEIFAIWDHMYNTDEIENVFLQTLREFYDQILIKRYDKLLQKAKNSDLSNDEKKEMQTINIALSKR